MKFKVTRTSQDKWQHYQKKDQPPFEGAVWEEGFGSEQGEWVTEINTLEELISFIEKYGAEYQKEVVVITKDDEKPEIEIYDYWRE